MASNSGRAFVIRPFGVKANRKGKKIDFDHVDSQLIEPAIAKAGLSGGTTAEFVQAGNIREDMFRQLLAADLAIADISIHNANAFYELGIRHALRDQFTILLKAGKNFDDDVFDLSTDRYLVYDPDHPEDCLPALTAMIEATLKSEVADSPIFKLLPGLTSVDPSKVVMVPLVFREDVEQAAHDRNALLKLAAEATAKPWETEGLRLVGRAQFKLGDHEGSRDTWELIRKFDRYDGEANQKLATNFQKLGELILSRQAAERALKSPTINDWDSAEINALVGSNFKIEWRNGWKDEVRLEDRQVSALISLNLQKSYESYRRGFECHRSHYYSGLNAVAMRSMQVALAKRHPARWASLFRSKRRAEFELEDLEIHLQKLAAATELAIESSIRNYPKDRWALTSRADLMLLASPEPDKVDLAYRQATENLPGFTKASLSAQLKIYTDLGIFGKNVKAALSAVPAGKGEAANKRKPARTEKAKAKTGSQPRKRASAAAPVAKKGGAKKSASPPKKRPTVPVKKTRKTKAKSARKRG